jgi:hypothetical protein
VVECLLSFLSVEDAVALACSSKGWRGAVNQEIIWRVLRKREGVRNKPNYLSKEYRDYAEKYVALIVLQSISDRELIK